MKTLWQPLQRFLSNPSLVALVFFLLTLGLTFYILGQWLLPVIVAVVIAYLLEGVIKKITQFNIPRIAAVSIVFLIFSSFIFYIFFILAPTILFQAKTLINDLPEYILLGQQRLQILPQRFPNLFTEQDINQIIANINLELTRLSRNLFSGKLFASLLAILTTLIYAILVPILVFFMLKDKAIILTWLGRFLPENKQILQDIWQEVDIQIGNYIRGKFTEILVVWCLTFIPLHLFGLQYSLLLSLMVGLSVLIPYIGATVVTVPILAVAYMQFGIDSTFWWIAGLYSIIQILDGNVIAPLIFSEAVNIHPVAIIISVLVFGGLWGFWGIFFAIPLATVVKAIIEAWRRYERRGAGNFTLP